METIRRLRRLSDQVPILAISRGGRGSAGDYLTVARALGATRTMNKPFKLRELATMEEDLLEEATLKSGSAQPDTYY